MFSLLVQGAFWGLLEQVIPRLETLVEYIGSMDLFIDSEIFGVRWSMSSMCDLRKSVRVPVSKNTLHSFWALISGHTSPLRVDGWHGLASGSHWPHWLASGSQPGIGGSVCCVCGARPLVYVTECSQVPDSNCGIQFQKTIGVHI